MQIDLEAHAAGGQVNRAAGSASAQGTLGAAFAEPVSLAAHAGQLHKGLPVLRALTQTIVAFNKYLLGPAAVVGGKVFIDPGNIDVALGLYPVVAIGEPAVKPEGIPGVPTPRHV